MPPCTFDSAKLSDQLIDQHEILVPKISTALGCDESEVSVALGEVLRFLYLVNLNEEGMLTPSVRVDLAWHEFILCTRAYDAFCRRLFGKFIHHSPGGSEAKNHQQFTKTLSSYEAEFGTPNTKYWGSTLKHVASCGECAAF